MALDVLDGNGAAKTVKTTLSGSDHVTHHHVDSSALPSGASTSAKQDTIIAAVDGLEALVTTLDSVIDAINAKLAALGQAAMAGSVPVAVASDQSAIPVSDNSSTLSVDDGGGALTVDGTVTANLAAGTNNIGDVDVLSVVPGTGATALGKAEDAAHTTGDTGVLGFAVRRDADTSLVDTDGDYAPLQVNASGSLKVAITAGAGSGGTAIADDAAFTAGSTSLTPIGGMFDDAAPDSVDEGDAGVVRMSANRNMYVQLRDAAGNERGLNIDASGNIGVTDAGAALTVDGTVTANLAAGTNNIGDVDILSIAAGDNNIGNVDIASIAAGDNNIGNVDLASAIPAGTNNIGDVDVLTVAPPSTVYAGQTAVTTAGTEVTLGSSQALTQGAWIKALHANTGFIYVGLNGVTSSTGFVLDAGESIFVPIDNRTTIYIDSSVNGEGVSYIAF